MGVVYRAHDEQLEHDVAIKVLPAGTLADEAARKRFRREALALAKLNHPNIATIFEFSKFRPFQWDTPLPIIGDNPEMTDRHNRTRRNYWQK
jgi:serine/threonine protein kinase